MDPIPAFGELVLRVRVRFVRLIWLLAARDATKFRVRVRTLQLLWRIARVH